MKKQAFIRWLWCLPEYLMICPVILIIAGLALPEKTAVPFTLILPFNTLVSILIVCALKKFKKIVISLIGIIYIAIISWIWTFFFMTGAAEEIILTAAATAFFFIYGVMVGVASERRELFFYSAGLIIHMISVFVIIRAPLLTQFQGTAFVLAIVYVLMGLPLANRRFLIRETWEKSSLKNIPGTVIRGNKIIVSVFLLLIALLSLSRAFLDALVYTASKIAGFIARILEWIASLNQPGGEQIGAPEPMLPMEEGQANPVVSLILDILAFLFFLAVVGLIIWYIVRNYKRIYSVVYSFLSNVFSRFQKWGTTDEGYFDRQESLLKTELPKSVSFIKKLFHREPRWRDMKDNAGRVRFLYSKFVMDRIKRGFRYTPSNTPCETVNRIHQMEKGEKQHTSILHAYNKVRYGEKEIDQDTVNALKDMYL